jgi:hypothetical protein
MRLLEKTDKDKFGLHVIREYAEQIWAKTELYCAILNIQKLGKNRLIKPLH